jgi:hypothetical protein
MTSSLPNSLTARTTAVRTSVSLATSVFWKKHCRCSHGIRGRPPRRLLRSGRQSLRLRLAGEADGGAASHSACGTRDHGYFVFESSHRSRSFTSCLLYTPSSSSSAFHDPDDKSWNFAPGSCRHTISSVTTTSHWERAMQLVSSDRQTYLRLTFANNKKARGIIDPGSN